MSHEWWLQGCAAFVLGAVFGSWVTWHFVRRRSEARERRAADEFLQRHAQSTEQLRAAQLRAQTDLELARNEFRRHLNQVAQ